MYPKRINVENITIITDRIVEDELWVRRQVFYSHEEELCAHIRYAFPSLECSQLLLWILIKYFPNLVLWHSLNFFYNEGFFPSPLTLKRSRTNCLCCYCFVAMGSVKPKLFKMSLKWLIIYSFFFFFPLGQIESIWEGCSRGHNKDFEYLSKTQMCSDTNKTWKRLKAVTIKR